MKEQDELNRLYHDAERSLLRRFLTEHQVIRVLMQGGTEEIRDHFCNSIRRLTQEGEAECLGLFAMWLTQKSASTKRQRTGIGRNSSLRRQIPIG
jgi:hypothetical protein